MRPVALVVVIAGLWWWSSSRDVQACGGAIMLPYGARTPSPLNAIHGDGKWRGRDYLMPAGTPVRAPITGSVVRKGRDNYCGPYGCGNTYIIFRSLDGRVEVAYLHGNYHASGKVRKGDVVGTTASNGNSSDPHEHVSIYVDGNLVDPEAFRCP